MNWSFLTKKQNNSILLVGSQSYQISEVRNIYKELFSEQIDAFENVVNPDFFQISKDDFGKNSIPVDEIRNWLNKNNFQPFQHPKKLFVIWSAENLEDEAQNTLLKTLEEHSSNSVFVLTTINQQLLLPTVLSRCQQYVSLEKDLDLKNNYLNLDFKDIPSVNEAVEKILKITNSSTKWSEAKLFLQAMINYCKNNFQSGEKYIKIEYLLHSLECCELYVNLKLILYNSIQVLLN